MKTYVITGASDGIGAELARQLAARHRGAASLVLAARNRDKLVEVAAQCHETGADAIVVSNHGGRQVDGERATLDALPEVVEAAAGIPVLLDSGIRSGADIAKALALGARAVLLGRPYVYGLALDGEDGVRAVIRNMIAELDLTLAQTSTLPNDGSLSIDWTVKSESQASKSKDADGDDELVDAPWTVEIVELEKP